MVQGVNIESGHIVDVNPATGAVIAAEPAERATEAESCEEGERP